ncbi:hypothetical protein ACKVV1_005711 [Pyricularia oryzae]
MLTNAPTAALVALVAGLVAPSLAQSIAEINGNKFVSPLNDQDVKNVTGVVLAKGPNGIWLRSDKPDNDPLTSEAVYVYDSKVGANLAVGDLVALDGRVLEYRSDNKHLFLTEVTTTKNVRKLSSGNPAVPLVIGKDTSAPPTEQYTSLDDGDIFATPNAAARLTEVNPVLDPTKYGLDFWESLNGELVTVRAPVALNRPNTYGDIWVAGDWPTTGRNARGGLTTLGVDANPEAILIGTPLDGTKNPADTKLGDQMTEVTGVVTYAFGFYRILPLTAIRVATTIPFNPRNATLASTGSCSGVTVGIFNVENLCPSSAHLPAIAAQLVDALKTPDLVFLQEVQDDSCATNDGVVDATNTLEALRFAVSNLTDGKVDYSWVEVAPVDNQDGGQPGGNIRVAYLYKPSVLTLAEPTNSVGTGADANEVLPGPTLKFNPGRIDPANAAWAATRKPLVAAWKALNATKPFFTVNVHFSSKGGSSSLHGDLRTPDNSGVTKRTQQATVTGEFIAKILAEDPEAQVIAAGDFNEFIPVSPLQTFMKVSGLLDLDEVVEMAPEERYSYLFDMNTQQLDHTFVSPSLSVRTPCSRRSHFQHLHVNTWSDTAGEVSDHDPSVGRFNVCA